MKRYYIFFNGRKSSNSEQIRPFNIMIHNILLSDEEDSTMFPFVADVTISN